MESHSMNAQDLLTASLETWVAFSPFLLFGALLSGMLHVLLPSGFIRRHLRGRRGVWKAVALGIPLPLCSCGVIPAGLGLKKDGASDGATLGFIISTPQTGVDAILVSGAFLGWPFALLKVVAAAVTGVVGGHLADGLAPVGALNHDPSSEASPPAESPPAESPPAESPPDTSEADQSTLKRLIDHSLSILEPIWGWVVAGVLISALLEVHLPEDLLIHMGAYSVAVAFGVTLLASLPLYVCATASVPIAAALVAKGFPIGAALVFLMAGPATNVATLGAVYRGLGGRVLGVYLGTLIIGSISFGLLFESWLAPSAREALAHAHELTGGWMLWTAVLSGLIFIGFAFNSAQAVLNKWRLKIAPKNSTEDIVHFGVEGMTCGGCVRKLERVLNADENISEVVVQRAPDEVRIIGSLSRTRAQSLIREAGFTPIELAPRS
jgi:uncharacterized protein